MEKKLSAMEAMELTNQLIEKEMTRSGRTYKEVSQEFRAKMKEKLEKPQYSQRFEESRNKRNQQSNDEVS